MDNRIPIIDLESCRTSFDKVDEGKNRWDNFFKPPFNLNITDIPLSHDYPIYECSPMDLFFGILLGGADISAIRPQGHWVQPSPETLINHAQWLMIKEGYEYIFLATEDFNVYQKFKKVFGKKFLVTKTKFLDYTNYSNYI